jgi:uncharacterized protein YodC (DUF2158 family)
MSDTIKPGDVVQLKSGGPYMTVEVECGDTGKVDVVWYDTDTKKMETRRIASIALTKQVQPTSEQ